MENLTEIRHCLHQLAEPSGKETQTKAFILKTLKLFQPTAIHTFRDSNNLLAVYDSGKEGGTLLFRGDFDAVRVAETIDVPYASATAGVSHKCGHDGHTTILLGLAEQLWRQPLPIGRVLLFFQSAEETGAGAAQLLDSHILDHFAPDAVYALHNIPGIEAGTVICREGSFTCSVISCDIELHGHTSHAAEPQLACCPYDAAKRIADKLLSRCRCDIRKEDYLIITLVEFRIGEPAYGVTAGHGVLRFTIRTRSDRNLQLAKKEIADTANEVIAQTEGLSGNIVWKEHFAAAENHAGAVQRIRNVASACKVPYIEKEVPFSWGEDFGLLTQYYPGALFGLGSGVNQPPLHHPQFDFPDRLIPIGIDLFYRIAANQLQTE